MNAAELIGTWMHSREESEGGLAVYRRTDYNFPRTRAPRRTLTLRSDGTADVGQPGPADRNVQSPCRWSLSDSKLVLTCPNNREEYEILSLAPDKLVLKS